MSRVVLVTGGSKGIGLATARAFAAQGDRVAVTYRSGPPPTDEGLLGVPCDVTDADQVEAAFAAIEEQLGPVEILVSNAGITADMLVLRMKDADFERVLGRRTDVDVLSAMQGRFGIDLAHQHRPSLILLDLHLPDISGEEVLRRLLDDPLTASIPVVMVTADATAGQVQRLLSAGAAAYPTKPLGVAKLLVLVDEMLAAR